MSREIVDREHVGRLMHESWSRTKRAQGFHGPSEPCSSPISWTKAQCEEPVKGEVRRCVHFHADLIPWDDLPEKQKDINRHAFDDVLPYFERLLAQEREPMECGHPKACLVEREITNIEKNEGPLNDTEHCSACAEREKVCKEHRLVETHWHGEGLYHCTCGAEIKATSEDGLRWIFQSHCVSEGIALAQREIERLLARERLLAPSPCGQQGHIANDWYSVCSAHGFYQDSCGNCKCGDCFRCKELQAEREKVREKTLLELDENCDMCGNPLGDAVCVSCVNQRVGAAVEECANQVKSFALTQEADIVKHQGNLTRRDVAGIIGARFAGRLVNEIRQLDLTTPNEKEGK